VGVIKAGYRLKAVFEDDSEAIAPARVDRELVRLTATTR
jgi:hypothetical protein